MDLITGVDTYLRSGLLPYYYTVVAFGSLFLIAKFHFNKQIIFLVLLFSEGLFAYIGNKFQLMFRDIYVATLILLPIILFSKNIFFNRSKIITKINIVFLLFTISFWVTYSITDQSLLTNLSQYGKKYLLPFLFFHEINSLRFTEKKMELFTRFFWYVLIIQILLSILKIILFGFGESIVGSISFSGGGLATTLPIVGLLFIWIKSKGQLNRNEWLFLFGMFFIAIASNKRAPVFVIPIVLALLYFYVAKSKTLLTILKYVPIFLLLAYLGIRSNPTLNPENSRWGSFNVGYAYNYAKDYTFGSGTRKSHDSDIAYGRGSTLIALFSKDALDKPPQDFLFGEGVDKILGTYADFDANAYGVASKGSLNRALSCFISLGFLGLFFQVLYGLLIIGTIQQTRLRYLVVLIFLWDYFLYSVCLLTLYC